MPLEISSLAPSRALVSALRNTRKRIALLVGSPMSMPDASGVPGVPGVSSMVELVQTQIGPELRADYEKALAAVGDAHRYQQSMAFLRDWMHQDAVNAVVRKAVRRARCNPEGESQLSDEALEQENSGWYLPAGTRDLGALVVESPERFGPILTTNFDPLLSVAVQRAGGKFMRTSLDADGRLNLTESSEKHAAHIIHLHGFWLRSDTLHTQGQLSRPRPYLAASLKQLIKDHTLVVVGYGGWDDIFTRALAELDYEGQASVDVLWAFYESEPALVRARYERLFALMDETTGRGRLRTYGGVNCHELFKQLREEFVTRTAVPPPSASSLVKTATTQESAPSPTMPSVPPSTTAPQVEKTVPLEVPAPTPATRSGAEVRPVLEAPALQPPQSVVSAPRQRVPRALLHSALTLSLLVAGFGLLRSSGNRALSSTKDTTSAGSLTAASSAKPQTQKRQEPAPTAGALVPQGYRTSNGAPRAAPTVAPSATPITIDALRRQHHVNTLAGGGAGLLVGQLQPGTYGFMPLEAAPLLSAARLLDAPSDQDVEVHRSQDGTLFLVGYVHSSSARALTLANPADIILVAAPSDSRTQLVSIPFSRMNSVGVRQDKSARVLLIGLDATER